MYITLNVKTRYYEISNAALFYHSARRSGADSEVPAEEAESGVDNTDI